MDNLEVSQLCVSMDSSLETVISCFENLGGRIVLVVDDHKCLLGTITDGDVRRALIDGLAMTTKASDIMNASPVVLPHNSSNSTILRRMTEDSILHIPLVNEDGKLVSLASITDFKGPMPKQNPVLIMAGGFGTRLMPLTKDTPKPMIKIGDTPMLEIIVRRLEQEGFQNIFISTHYKAEVIKDYFGDGQRFGVSISYVDESEPLGTGGAVTLMPKIEAPLIVINGDVITDINFSALMEFHHENNADCTAVFTSHDVNLPFGVIVTDGVQVKSLREKPTYKYKVNAGIYVISDGVVNAFRTPTRIDMPEILQNLLTQGKVVVAFPLHELWADVGSHDELRRVALGSETP